MCNDKGEVDVSARQQWKFMGRPVRRTFWQHCHCTSQSTVTLCLKLLKDGALEFPECSKQKRFRDKPQYHKADAWFLQMYLDLAEPFPYDDDDALDWAQQEHELICSDHPLFAYSLNSGAMVGPVWPRRNT